MQVVKAADMKRCVGVTRALDERPGRRWRTSIAS